MRPENSPATPSNAPAQAIRWVTPRDGAHRSTTNAAGVQFGTSRDAVGCDHRSMAPRKTTSVHTFDAQAFFDSAGVESEVMTYLRSETVFSQGEVGDSVIYIQKGGVKLSVASKLGREAVIAMLGPGDFCGEAGLVGQSVRMATATALTPTTALVLGKDEMLRALHAEHALSDHFISYMLSRNVRIEEDLIDQLFNSSEKRLARALLLLARYGTHDTPHRVLPRISQARLADMAGITRSRASAFLSKFKRLGFIEDGTAGLRVNDSLLGVLLRD